MIGRIHIISFSTIILLYVLVAAWKYLPVFSEVENEIVVENRSDQADIVKFWEQYYRASSYRSEKDYEQAAAYYEKALELNEEHEDALYYLGSMYLFQRNFEKAEEVWLRLEEIQPNSPRTHLQLGTLYFCLDKENPLYAREKATEKIEYAWNLNREETGSPLLLSKITLLNGDMETAGKLLDAVISTNLMDYQARYLKGLLEWVGGEDQKSREMFREARDIYQSLAYSEVQGEGATETGARAMLSEDRFCDPFEIRIGELLGGDEMLNHQDQYEKFSMSMEAWRELEKGIR